MLLSLLALCLGLATALPTWGVTLPGNGTATLSVPVVAPAVDLLLTLVGTGAVAVSQTASGIPFSNVCLYNLPVAGGNITFQWSKAIIGTPGCSFLPTAPLLGPWYVAVAGPANMSVWVEIVTATPSDAMPKALGLGLLLILYVV